MSYQRALHYSHVAGLIALIAQVVVVVLKGSGATDLPWSVVLMPTMAGVAYLAVSLGTYYLLTAHGRVRRRVWRRFDHDDKAATAPLADEPVWVIEEYYYAGPTIGWFDGLSFRVRGYGDDCRVTWWAPITYPEPPPTWRRERNQVLAELDEEAR